MSVSIAASMGLTAAFCCAGFSYKCTDSNSSPHGCAPGTFTLGSTYFAFETVLLVAQAGLRLLVSEVTDVSNMLGHTLNFFYIKKNH